MKERMDGLVSTFYTMQGERAAFEDVWRQVARYLSPTPEIFSGSENRETDSNMMRRDQRDIDNTARRAVQIFAAGMLSGVSPPSDQWFQLAVADKHGGRELSRRPAVARWLENVEGIFRRDFHQKNFYAQQDSSYRSLGLFGMQCMLVGEHDERGAYYRDTPVDEIYIAEDYTGKVNCVLRDMRLPLRQAMERFGKERLSPCLRKMAEAKNADLSRRVQVVHAVLPKSAGYENLMGNNKLPFASYYFEPGEGHLISESGFDSLPYVVTRAYSFGRSPYSISPGTLALADTRMVNELKALILESGQLRVAPPFLAPDNGLLGRLNYAPYAMNLYRKSAGMSADDFSTLQLGQDPGFGLELLSMAKQDVNEAFFVDLFMLIHNRTQMGRGTPTAAEIQQLAAEKSFLLGPILVNQQQENFDNLFSRVYAIKEKRGELPPPPKELAGADIDIVYISPLVRAQQEVKSNSIMKTLAELGQVAQMRPEVLDLVDLDTAMREVMEQRGMPVMCLRPEEAVAKMREARMQGEAQAAQQRERMEGMQGLLGAYGQLSQAPQEGSVAAELLGKL